MRKKFFTYEKWPWWFAAVAFTFGCGSSSNSEETASGGAGPQGGTSQVAGAAGQGGSLATGGGAVASTGGVSFGGAVGNGGTLASGGASGMGPSSGGSLANGGIAGMGTSNGGVTGAGGAGASGGTNQGGTNQGGTNQGGANQGGAGGSAGASGSGGSASCDWSDPPANVAGWIDESWMGQLGSNVKSRKDWLLDSIMLGKGNINVCVRWGASTAPTQALKDTIGASLGRFMTDWFKALGTYGCFPYPNGVNVKVTGWAVKPGNEAWVSNLDSSIKVYTETDSDGEPKCPDACSFFNNWTHTFPNCPGGEAFHTDYWAWLDDTLPGGGGAAAVGGDWGFRMPLSSFTRVIDQPSTNVVEHEMGHGFGFQDYYSWTGSTPAGGSLMIVGSSSSQKPTVGDTWLLRRTWKEAKTLRGW